MQKKKDNFLERIVKRDYNNELETIIEQKDYDENARSMLLNILYKIEAAYKDVETVKQDIESKEEYIQNYIDIIQNKCDHIRIIHMREQENQIGKNRTYLVDKEKKEIQCYPIERKLLYALSKISKKDRIVKSDYYIIDETLSNLINVGNNINMVEPMRDFNGYSWTTLSKEIESTAHNLVYQNLRILLGESFLIKWINNSVFMLDYYDKLKNELDEEYGTEDSKKMLKLLSKISILLEVKYNKDSRERLIQTKKQLDDKIEKLQNKEKFVEDLTIEKNRITREIRNIDTIINNKDQLEQEYIRRNEELPLDKKIFSMRVLSEIMVKERETLFDKIDELNKQMNPHYFVEFKKDLEQKYEILKIVDSDENKIEKEIEVTLLKIQKIFLKCIQKQVKKIEGKQQMIKLIYQFRYYILLPFNPEKKIIEIETLRKDIDETTKIIIKKSQEMKVLQKIAKNEETDFQILRNIFTSRIIKLENVELKLTKEKDNIYLQLFDENLFENKVEIGLKDTFPIKDLKIRFNKRVKIFE